MSCMRAAAVPRRRNTDLAASNIFCAVRTSAAGETMACVDLIIQLNARIKYHAYASLARMAQFSGKAAQMSESGYARSLCQRSLARRVPMLLRSARPRAE